MEKGIEKISFGATFEGGVPILGLFMFFFGLLLLIFDFTFWGGYPFVFFGIIFFLNIKGVLIDYENNRIKKYINYVFFKLGNWRDLSEFKYIGSKEISSHITRKSPASYYKTKIKYFDIFIFNDLGDEVLINSFEDIKSADAFIKTYSLRLKKIIKN